MDEKWEILRANKISKEFGLDFIYIASGNEYANVNELATTAVQQYIKDVKSKNFPNKEEQYWC